MSQSQKSEQFFPQYPLIEILENVESHPDSDFIKELKRFHDKKGSWNQDTIYLIRILGERLYKL